MNGVSHMLPFVVGGGIMIALAFLLDDYSIDPANFGMNTPLAAFFKTVGSAAFSYMLPILAGFIAMSIADRPGLAVGFAGGVLAMNGTNFAGIAAGVAAQLRHQGVDGPGQGCRVGDARHLHFPGSQQPSRLVHQPGLQVGAADVDADVFHNRSLPFCRLMASSLLSNWVTKSRPAL